MSGHVVQLELDHLVVAAASLEEGVSYVSSALGIPPAAFSPEGRHALMGTHNRLLPLGSGCYLEVIAVDPAAAEAEAAPPAAPRWFALDDPAVQGRLARHGPLLLHWVARVCGPVDLEEAVAAAGGTAAAGGGTAAATAAAAASGAVERRQQEEQQQEERQGSLLRVLAMQRGDFRWRITVPADGSLPSWQLGHVPGGSSSSGGGVSSGGSSGGASVGVGGSSSSGGGRSSSGGGGVLPSLIQWDVPYTPAQRLPHSGLMLTQLVAEHPDPDAVTTALEAFGAGGLLEVVQGPVPRLSAQIQTPAGLRTLA